MKKASEKLKIIKLSAWVAIISNFLLSLLKVFASFASGSAALLADGIDSACDVLISLVTLVVARIMSKPADTDHPWGHGRAETVATVLLSFILFFVGGQLIVSGITSLIRGNNLLVPSTIAIVVTVFSIFVKGALSAIHFILGKKVGSSILKATAKNFAGDVLISIGVLIGLIASDLTSSGVADVLVQMIIGVWIIKTAVGIFLEANTELMDGSHNQEPYWALMKAVEKTKGASNPHRIRMRKIAGFWDIDCDIEVDPNLTVSKAHNIASKVEENIKKELSNVYDIVVHIEPHGDDAHEGFGVSAKNIKKRKK